MLEGALRDPGTRMVTLVGPAGVGKSVLAAAVASTLTPGPAGTPGTPVFDALRGTAPGAGAMPAAGRTLLLLDGCDHARRRSPEAMAALLAAHPGVTVLATALEPLGLYGERTVQVAPLPVPLPHEVETGDPTELGRVPAVVLFVLRATRSCPGFALTEENAEAVGRLCALLEGLPASLELAAGRMRLYSPAALLARLTRSPGALSGGPASTPERHRSLAALAEFGLEGLTADERELVERLSVHEGGFGALGVPRSAEDALDRLLERGVLRLAHPDGARAAEPRYAVPEPVRSYCLARLADAGDGRREEAADEHADRYARLAATAAPRGRGPGPAPWVGRLAHQAGKHHGRREGRGASRGPGGPQGPPGTRKAAPPPFPPPGPRRGRAGARPRAPNPDRGALERLVARGDRATAAATVLACREPWLAQGRLREGTAWCERMPAEGPPGLPEPVLARLTELAGVLALARGETAEAVHLLRSALDRSKRLGDRRQTAAIGAQWGEALLADGDPHGAVAALEPAAAALESMGAAAAAARARTSLARAQHELGRTRAAAKLLDQAQSALRRVGDVRGLAEALRGRAALEADSGEHEDAFRSLREGLRLAEECAEHTRLPWLVEDFALAALRVTPEQRPRVVRLLTASEALRARIGATAPAARRASLAEVSDGLRVRLGWTGFTRARTEGLALGPAGALREALSSPAPARTRTAEEAGPQPLTPRQVQVAMLVAEGMTNRQIAEKLGLSEWTVVNHVRQIMRRLGCSSRIQVAWASGRWS
ncbi:LuxR C-terminal-related transcriptional regulator [Streptomyces sp. NPDC059385]|uniref:helix-turn-helix transcriptional regulator n=1 Tax=Streptomyces sp. NPDC059385 TaxID=3346817 RepID=UPI00367ADB4D